jgi:hypothetical protein
LEEPEPCQTSPNLRSLERIDGVGVGGATTYVVNMDCNGYWLGVVTSMECDDQDAKQLQLAQVVVAGAQAPPRPWNQRDWKCRQ